MPPKILHAVSASEIQK